MKEGEGREGTSEYRFEGLNTTLVWALEACVCLPIKQIVDVANDKTKNSLLMREGGPEELI